MAQEMRSEKVAIVTVHGTNDQAAGDGERKKWWEPESPFAQALLSRLAAQGVDAEITPHVWSGANSAMARERGAEALAKEIKAQARTHGEVHVIGHSHGGNVASHAAELVNWGLPRRRQHMRSLTTVGTPFFRNQFGRMEVFGAFAFLVLTLFGVISLPILAVLSVRSRFLSGSPGDYIPQIAFVVTLFLITLVVFALVFPLALRGVRRVIRFRSRGTASSQVLSIWHENDEAISFLQKMETIDIRPMPPWGFFRGSRSTGMTIGIWAILIMAIAVLLWAGVNMLLSLLLDSKVVRPDQVWVPQEPSALWTLLGIAFAGSLTLFALIYLLVRLVFALGDVVTMPWLNGLVRGRIRGMAFGADGDQGIGEVSTRSHTHPTREIKLDGVYAERLRSNSAAAAAQLLDQYRWSLFSVGGDANEALSRMAEDVMTWKSLVHTTYFDHDEMADIVARHILASRA